MAITAQDAINLVNKKELKSHLEYLDRCIVEAAESGQHFVIIRAKPFEMAVRQLPKADESSMLRKVINDLRARGFTVTQHWEEGQFVDCGMKIDWSE